MWSIRRQLSGWDWPGIFSYTTNKQVEIRDYRLGVLRYLFLIAIWTYVLFDILNNYRYNIKLVPSSGMVQAHLTMNGDTSAISSADCEKDDSCMYWTPEQISAPTTADDQSMFVATSVLYTAYNKSEECRGQRAEEDEKAAALFSIQQLPEYIKSASCAQPNIAAQLQPRVVLDPQLTLAIQHSVQLPDSPLPLTSNNMRGVFISNYGGDTDSTATARQQLNRPLPTRSQTRNMVRNQTDGYDRLPLFDLLASVQLNGAAWNRTTSYTLLVTVDYRNQRSIFNGGNDAIRYTYRPELMEERPAPVTASSLTHEGLIVDVKKYGIRILFRQTGEIGHFDFMTLLVHLGTVLLLLAVALFLLEALMMYGLPERYLYTARKFERYHAIKEARPIHMTASPEEDTISFYTARQSGVLQSAVGLSSPPTSPAQRRVSFLRVTNPASSESLASSSASYTGQAQSPPPRYPRTSSLGSLSMHQIAEVLNAPAGESPSQLRRDNIHRPPIDTVTEESQSQSGASEPSSSKSTLMSGSLATSATLESLVSSTRDHARIIHHYPFDNQQQQPSSDHHYPPNSAPSVAPSSAISRSNTADHQLMPADAARRIYRYEAPTANSSWVPNTSQMPAQLDDSAHDGHGAFDKSAVDVSLHQPAGETNPLQDPARHPGSSNNDSLQQLSHPMPRVMHSPPTPLQGGVAADTGDIDRAMPSFLLPAVPPSQPPPLQALPQPDRSEPANEQLLGVQPSAQQSQVSFGDNEVVISQALYALDSLNASTSPPPPYTSFT